MKLGCFVSSVWLWTVCFYQVSTAIFAASFVNFETAPVHPVALSPDGRTLAVCNLPDNRLELFDVSAGVPVPRGDVPVGLDPVSVRFRTTNEVWVVNHISSSVSVVDLVKRRVVATLNTLAGPADVAFAGSPLRAFISCAKENTVQVFDPITRSVVTNLSVDGERPKALAVGPDGSRVYVAIFESGNGSTILAGGALWHPDGPYGGQMPVPNDGLNLRPPLYQNPDFDPQLYTNLQPDSLIVRKNAAGRWMDDNHGDWTEFISGTNATLPFRGGLHGRPGGWDMPDHDVAVIDTATLAVSYATGLMNICTDLAANPASGTLAVIGTDATNERRFEPNLRGTFVQVKLALVDPLTLGRTILDLNLHLDYSTSTVARAVRDLSVGDPRGIVWNAAGTRAYITGMGSRNLVVIDAKGNRVAAQPVELGDGPMGLVLDEPRARLYVLNRFSATLSVVDTATLDVVTNAGFFDPTPPAIKTGRKHLYDTRRNSGLGQASCASCHVDARFDRLAWDLGNPAADMMLTPVVDSAFHPLKGPLVTQTLQDIIGSGPLHWRGDRAGIEEFNSTFTDLLGADALLTPAEMQEFKDFLATIHFPPNRFRNFDNSLPSDLPLPGLRALSTASLPNGDARRGHEIFTAECRLCHQKESGRGVAGDDPLALRDGSRPFKSAQLRNLPDKLGMDMAGTSSRAGFGLRFDGRDDSLARFLSDVDLTGGEDEQRLADLLAFLLAFSGSGVGIDAFPLSKDVPAAVGRQITLTRPGTNELVTAMVALADLPANRADLVARGAKDGLNRGWFYDRDTATFQSDRNNENLSLASLLSLAAPDGELTFTVVPLGSGRRLGIDRDEDAYFDRTEIESGWDPSDAYSHGSNAPPRLDPLPSFVIHSGIPVTLALNAADPDLPGQTLTFSFGSGTPAGATLDPAAGAFAWTPTPEQSDRSYRIAVRVTDNGSPALSDSQATDVTVVGLRVVAIFREEGSGATVVVFRAIPGRRYQLQSKKRLDDLDWTDVPGGLIASAPAEQFALRDDAASSAPQRFYRIYSAP